MTELMETEIAEREKIPSVRAAVKNFERIVGDSAPGVEHRPLRSSGRGKWDMGAPRPALTDKPVLVRSVENVSCNNSDKNDEAEIPAKTLAERMEALTKSMQTKYEPKMQATYSSKPVGSVREKLKKSGELEVIMNRQLGGGVRTIGDIRAITRKSRGSFCEDTPQADSQQTAGDDDKTIDDVRKLSNGRRLPPVPAPRKSKKKDSSALERSQSCDNLASCELVQSPRPSHSAKQLHELTYTESFSSSEAENFDVAHSNKLRSSSFKNAVAGSKDLECEFVVEQQFDRRRTSPGGVRINPVLDNKRSLSSNQVDSPSLTPYRPFDDNCNGYDTQVLDIQLDVSNSEIELDPFTRITSSSEETSLLQSSSVVTISPQSNINNSSTHSDNTSKLLATKVAAPDPVHVEFKIKLTRPRLTTVELNFSSFVVRCLSTIADEERKEFSQIFVSRTDYKSALDYIYPLFEMVQEESDDESLGVKSSDLPQSFGLDSVKKEILSRSVKRLEAIKEEKSAVLVKQDELKRKEEELVDVMLQNGDDKQYKKFRMYIDDLDKVLQLLLKLSERLANLYNDMMNLTDREQDSACQSQKTQLAVKYDDLMSKFHDAVALKENVDGRSQQVSQYVSACLTVDQCDSYHRCLTDKCSLMVSRQSLDERLSETERLVQRLSKLAGAAE